MSLKNNITVTSALLFLAAPAASAANILTNGDFESFSAGNPTGWTHGADIISSEVTGLDGSGSAVQMGIPSGGSSNSSISQTVTSVGDNFIFQFDFQLLTTGNSNNGARTLNFNLRNFSEDPLINARSLFEGGSNDGNLQFYDGTSWQNLVGQTEQFNQTDVYRIVITGADFTSNTLRSYDVELLNLTDSTSAGGATGVTDFHHQNAGSVRRVQFERGRSNLDYIIDNASLETVPEPSSAMLALLATPALFIRRRK